MIDLNSEPAREYLAESREHIAAVEGGLVAFGNSGAQTDVELFNRIFRAVHSVQGGAGFFDLEKIGELAGHTEDVLALIRSGRLVPTPERIRVLLGAADRLLELVRHPGTSNQADIAAMTTALAGLSLPANEPRQRGEKNLRVLLVEDDFAGRLLLQTFLSRYGECHVAVNGKETVEAFDPALAHGLHYDLVCMDIMMPVMDGREAVRQIRALEEARGILSSCGVKIIMTTAATDVKEVIRCFQDLCDSYIMKPIDLAELLSRMRSYQLAS